MNVDRDKSATYFAQRKTVPFKKAAMQKKKKKRSKKKKKKKKSDMQIISPR